MSTKPGFAALRVVWHGLPANERRAMRGLAALALAALVWFVAVAPAWRSVNSLPAQIEALDAQLQQVQQLSAQAKSLQTGAPVARADALRSLDALTKLRLGATATVQGSADRTSVTLKGASSEALVAWLGQARQNVGATVEQANLRQVNLLWDGTLLLSLPSGP